MCAQAKHALRCGEIKRLVMGLDRFQKTPCGFCFVEYYTHQDALDCMKYIGGTKLDERIIRTDLDEGFAEGRQYGYGFSSSMHTRPSLTEIPGAENLVARFETNIAMNTIRAVAVTAGLMLMNTITKGKGVNTRILDTPSASSFLLDAFALNV